MHSAKFVRKACTLSARAAAAGCPIFRGCGSAGSEPDIRFLYYSCKGTWRFLSDLKTLKKGLAYQNFTQSGSGRLSLNQGLWIRILSVIFQCRFNQDPHFFLSLIRIRIFLQSQDPEPYFLQRQDPEPYFPQRQDPDPYFPQRQDPEPYFPERQDPEPYFPQRQDPEPYFTHADPQHKPHTFKPKLAKFA